MSSTTAASVSEATKKFDDLKKSMGKDAQEMVTKNIPRRIEELNEILKSADFKLSYEQYASPVNVPCPPGADETNRTGSSNFIEAGVLNGTKVLVLPDGVIRLNETIQRLQEIIKPLILQLVDDCNLLRMWIQLLIPKVEDGNNFGVGIQEECLEQVSAVQKDSITYVDHVTRYHATRAKSVSKVAKYPHIEDFRRAVEELDQRQYYTIVLTLRQLRNDYSIVHDILTKNMEKIQKPRNSNVESLY